MNYSPIHEEDVRSMATVELTALREDIEDIDEKMLSKLHGNLIHIDDLKTAGYYDGRTRSYLIEQNRRLAVACDNNCIILEMLNAELMKRGSMKNI